ncbi:MAG: ribonuclease HII [Chitinispirillaceae bacterium]|nr:ribonuclease HII [Chitinispirillaceae bacterium]
MIKQQILENISARLYIFDRKFIENTEVCVVGIDEAGRGPLAGPVVAAAAVLELDTVIPGVNDSKKLSAAAREKLYGLITARAKSFGVGQASVEEIDRLNILQATFLAMRRALEAIVVPWTVALVDGNQRIPGIPGSRQKTIVGGDGLSASIAAASIIAKVTRDRIMKDYHARFPMYDFLSNRGYGTALHRQHIADFGLCEIHRRSFCGKFLTAPRV